MDTKEYRKISELTVNPKNPRGIKKDDFERLKKQIKKLGQYKPVIITQEGKVLGGNMRIRAYEDMGITDVWVSVVDAKTEAQEMEYILSDNDSAGYWEEVDLAEMLQELPDFDFSEYKVDLGDAVSLRELMNKFAPSLDDIDRLDQLKDKKKMVCPDCGYEFEA